MTENHGDERHIHHDDHASDVQQDPVSIENLAEHEHHHPAEGQPDTGGNEHPHHEAMDKSIHGRDVDHAEADHARRTMQLRKFTRRTSTTAATSRCFAKGSGYP